MTYIIIIIIIIINVFGGTLNPTLLGKGCHCLLHWLFVCSFTVYSFLFYISPTSCMHCLLILGVTAV